MLLFSRVLTVSGIILIAFGTVFTYQHFNPSVLAFSTPPKSTQLSSTANSSANPVILAIPSAHIKLPIFVSHIVDNNWQTTTQGISYLASSPIPGQQGNSILYGHNWEALLGNLVTTKPGDEVVITYANHSVKKFIIHYTMVVDPSDISILQQSTDKRITLYTCTGFLDSKRFVAVAILDDNKKSPYF